MLDDFSTYKPSMEIKGRGDDLSLIKRGIKVDTGG